ncbi:MAG: alpha-galactosidase, partial [Clostridia bacterium]|nr:alpha-galactosidase [Clostridia bacterium]
MYTLTATLIRNGREIAHNDTDNEDFTFVVEESENGLTGTLTARRDFIMKQLVLTTPRAFDGDDLFFANGWQSWTTSMEHSRKDNTRGITKLARFSKDAVQISGASGDYAFTTYGEAGVFHSWSYTYFRRAGSRFIDLWGSRSERNGFTMFEVDMNRGVFRIAKDIDGLAVSAGETVPVFDLCRIQDEYNRAFDAYFFDFIGLSRPKLDRMAGYTSWYNYFQDINESIILRDLDGLDRADGAAQVFQIDDGFEPAVGDWLTPDRKKFPNGLRPVVQKIHEKGYKAGLWLAPFCAQITSQISRKHPDWMIRDNQSNRRILAHFGWGGAFALDLYNPEVRDYLKQVFDTVLNDWGFDMVKLDFLYAACIQPRLGKTRGTLMCEAVDFLRELCGDKLILGCGVPLGACWGVFEACRIGTDVNKNFYGTFYNKINFNNEIPNSRWSMVNTIFRRGLDGRAFANDPDVFFLRDDNLNYSLPQKLLLAKVNDLCGSVLFM